ncbi:uncharacterized protein LOC143198880 [Rhynchophorus ferrugineus]|uniref:uncharacterized protein LOC143198880 n=1 Tax=Rhynchophorus ferrugineus TaxID=354439 RepID=UPI003FCD9706
MNVIKTGMECRICQNPGQTEDYVSIYNKFSNTTIIQIIINISSIKILEEDLLPKVICTQCFDKINLFNEFRKLIIQTDESLKFALYNENICSLANIDEDTIDSTLTDQSGNLSVKNSHKHLSKSRKTYECKECNKLFKKSENYKTHMTIHSGEKKYACEYCPKRFSRSYTLIYHRRIHTKEKPYKCDTCSKTFRSPSNFYVHKKIHISDKKYKCKGCEESFIQLESLEIHQRKVHTGERPFLCEICSSDFRSKASLITHQLDIHGEKKPCPHCKKLYSLRVLKSHIQRHEEQNLDIKRFPCQQCGKKFTSSSSRKKHFLIHTGEKPFSCEICQQRFNQKSALKTHMKVHSEIMPFLCDFCHKTFKYKHHLKSHVTSHHDKNQ